jgi:hypothetical protein
MNKQTTQPKGVQRQENGGNVFSKMGNKMQGWFNLFMGRPRYKKPAIQGSTEIKAERKKISPEEDSVTKDFKKVTDLFGKVFGKATQKIQPNAQKSAAGALQVTTKVAGNRLFFKVVRLFIIIFFLMILVFIGTKMYSILTENGEDGAKTVYTSPTPVPYKPSKPSVYAEDEFILELEEKLGVLEREIAGISIRETTLTPPILDYKINFDD